MAQACRDRISFSVFRLGLSAAAHRAIRRHEAAVVVKNIEIEPPLQDSEMAHTWFPRNRHNALNFSILGDGCNQRDIKGAKRSVEVYENNGDIESHGKMTAFCQTKCPKSAPFFGHFGAESPLAGKWNEKDVITICAPYKCKKTGGAVTKCQPKNHLKSTINRDAGAISSALGQSAHSSCTFGQNVRRLH